MPDYIVTEVVTYRVTDVAGEDAAIQTVIDSADRDTMFEAVTDRTAIRIDQPLLWERGDSLTELPA